MVLEIAHMSAGPEDSRCRKQNVEAKERDAKRKPAGSKKADLMDVRVIQRHLVYAVGLAADICTDQVLKGPEYFGKYGKIKKISVTWNNNSCSARQASAAAYVLYHSEDEAWNCIQSIDGAMWSGKQVRACYGTTKYCHSYLRKAACSNPECSYLHEPAPEEDTVTKDEMNPITGRKDILHLVHPGGTPRSRTKKLHVRPTSQPIGVPPASAASVVPGAPEPSPSKDSLAWAIPAPNESDAIGTDMLEVMGDSSSTEDSPQFVIAANAAPNAWPALSDFPSNADTFSDRASLSVGDRRPSTKDVVTGTASATDTTKEVVQGARMLPLAAPGRARFGIRGVVVNGSAPLLSPSRELQEDEHALSTMPSTELLGSRARLDLCADSPGGSPIAPPHSPSAMIPGPGDYSSVFSAPPEALQHAGDSIAGFQVQTTMPAPLAEHAQLYVSTAASAHAANGAEEHGGECVLSALDLLPASLGDALDGRASLPTIAQVEEGHSPQKAASYPATPVPAGLPNDPNLAGVVHPSGRKQSRFAFVNNEGTVCTAGGTSFSLPKDLDNLSDAPAFRPSSARMASMHMEAGDMSAHAMSRHARHSTGLHGWDQAAAEEHAQAVKQFSLPLEATMGAAAQHVLQQQQQQQQQQARLNPAVPSGLEQPPMTHESVVQAVSAQLQQIMSQGGHTPVSAAANRMMPAAGEADAGLNGMAGALPAGWSQMQQKAVPEQARPEQMHNTGIHFLQALLQQQQQELAAAGMNEARGMQHPSAGVAVSQAATRQGLAIKRPPQPPKTMSSDMGSSVGANIYQQHAMAQRSYMPQRSTPPMHDGHALHHATGVSHALHQGGVGAASMAMRRGMQYGQVPASVGMVDPTMQRVRALQHHMSQFGGDASYLAEAAACGYSSWDAAHDTYNAMLGGPQMHARQMAAPLGNWHPRGHGWE